MALLPLLGAVAARADDDFGSWHALSVTYFEDERWTLSTLGQLRYRDDSSRLYAYYLGHQVVRKVSPYLRIGGNYTYLPTKPAAGGGFKYQHRWETEVNPRWEVNARLTLDLRNRFEVRWLEGRGGTNERSRHRPQVTWRVTGFGPLETVAINNELFYDYDADRVSENRLTPLALGFRVNAQTKFSAYYMVRMIRGSEGWSNVHTLGTQVALKF